MYEFLLIIILAILGLLSHFARKLHFIEVLLRFSILCAAAAQLSTAIWLYSLSTNRYLTLSYGLSAALTFFTLFKLYRQFISWLLTALQIFITGQILYPAVNRQIKAQEYFVKKRILVPDSFPHLMALFIYTTAGTYLLTSSEMKTISSAFTRFIDPLRMQHLLIAGGLAFILLAFCGVGIYVTRSYKQVLARLQLNRPSKWQFLIGIALVIATFAYDAYWLIYTHNLSIQSSLTIRLTHYSATTFSIAGAIMPSVILAIIATTFTAIGEEVLIRGALQPVLGILPSALFHALLHSQLNHSPLLVLQIAVWSLMMGLCKRYTNTSTTIVAHAGVNILTLLLYTINP